MAWTNARVQPLFWTRLSFTVPSPSVLSSDLFSKAQQCWKGPNTRAALHETHCFLLKILTDLLNTVWVRPVEIGLKISLFQSRCRTDSKLFWIIKSLVSFSKTVIFKGSTNKGVVKLLLFAKRNLVLFLVFQILISVSPQKILAYANVVKFFRVYQPMSGTVRTQYLMRGNFYWELSLAGWLADEGKTGAFGTRLRQHQSEQVCSSFCSLCSIPMVSSQIECVS